MGSFLVFLQLSWAIEDTCSAQLPTGQPGLSLLQARHDRSAPSDSATFATPQQRWEALLDKKLGVNPSGAAAPLDETGYSAVADRCCQAEMSQFIERQVNEMGMEVCIPSGLVGIVPYHSCEKGPQSFAALTSNLLDDSAKRCTWLADVGQCKQQDPDCPSFEGLTPLADCGCSRSQAVLLDFEKATMVTNNLAGKGPGTGAEEMRFANIGEYPAGQPFELVIVAKDRYEGPTGMNGVTAFPKFGNIALNGNENPAGYSGAVTLELSFVRPGTSTPVVLPECFLAIFDLDGGDAVSKGTVSGKGYTGYVTDVTTDLAASRNSDGSTRFTATKNTDNPTDPMLATQEQRESMVMYFYHQVSTVEISLGVIAAPGKTSTARNFQFAGKSALMDRCGE